MSCYSLEFSQLIFGVSFMMQILQILPGPKRCCVPWAMIFWLGKLESGGKRWWKNPYFPKAICFTPTKFLWMKNATNKGNN